jgi:alpha-D-ribose 1-methylphosphonate 5-triphosphate synthase subunit PhnG
MMEHSEIVAEASPEAVREIAELIANRLPVKVLKPPSPGMVMVRHAEPLENIFFLLGEAFVTECEVEVDGELGYGCVLGSGEERALCGALVDAVMGSRHPFAGEVARLLEAEQQRIEARREAESRAVASTRVNFEVR